jgi:hypothetical protein
MADADKKDRPAGMGSFGAVKHAGTSPTVISSVALNTAAIQYSLLFHGSISANDDAGNLDQIFLVHVKRLTNPTPGWTVTSIQIGSSLGSLAVTGWTFAMNGDTLEASSTATADEMSMGGFLMIGAELTITGGG